MVDGLQMSVRKQKSAKQIYSQVVNTLIPIYQETEARQLVKMLLEDVLDISFEKILIDADLSLSKEVISRLDDKVAMLLDYNPIQYVLGKAHFFGRDFFVDSRVLIPRQETEELINEIVIDNKRPDLKILDIGSGSGCIGITLAQELVHAHVSSLDIDSGALEVTSKNARHFGVDIKCILNDVLSMDHLPDKYDIIVSNPPYVTEKEKGQMLNNVLDHEPKLALFVPDEDPLIFYKKIVRLSKSHLNKNGRLYLEINEQFGADMIALCETEKCKRVKLIQDLNGKDRFITARFD